MCCVLQSQAVRHASRLTLKRRLARYHRYRPGARLFLKIRGGFLEGLLRIRPDALPRRDPACNDSERRRPADWHGNHGATRSRTTHGLKTSTTKDTRDTA